MLKVTHGRGQSPVFEPGSIQPHAFQNVNYLTWHIISTIFHIVESDHHRPQCLHRKSPQRIRYQRKHFASKIHQRGYVRWRWRIGKTICLRKVDEQSLPGQSVHQWLDVDGICVQLKHLHHGFHDANYRYPQCHARIHPPQIRHKNVLAAWFT